MTKPLVFLCIFLFISCSQKDVAWIENKQLQKSIINTQNNSFFINDKQFMISATYLNPVLNLNENDQFLISIYPQSNKAQTLSLALVNDKEATIVKLKNDHLFIKFAPLANKWSEHYLIESEKVLKEDIRLNLQIYKKGWVELNFDRFLQNKVEF